MNKRTNLKKFRKSLGLTIEETAERLECTKAYYNNIELGKSTGSIEFWEHFQETFGVDGYDMWDLLKKEN